MHYLKLIRFPNLLIIVISQCIIQFGVLRVLEVQTSLDSLGFWLLVAATVLIAAGGYIINDIYDITADAINKPTKRIVAVHISKKKATQLYYLHTLIGLGCGAIVSIIISKPLYALWFLGICISLYLYSRFLKSVAIVGNILVSILVAMSLLIVGIFEIIPLISPKNYDQQIAIIHFIKDIAIFAFLINLLRELVKDIEDIQGDYAAHYKTLPILLGTKRTAQFTAVIGLITIFIIAVYSFGFLDSGNEMIVLVFMGIIIPLGYVCAQLWEATSTKQFKRLSLLLKVIMFLGVCIIPLFSYTLHYAI